MSKKVNSWIVAQGSNFVRDFERRLNEPFGKDGVYRQVRRYRGSMFLTLGPKHGERPPIAAVLKLNHEEVADKIFQNFAGCAERVVISR